MSDNFLTNVFGGIASQLLTSSFIKSVATKVATVALTALTAKFAISDNSWVPGAAAAVATIVALLWDSLQATPGKLATRTAALPGVSVTTPDGVTRGK